MPTLTTTIVNTYLQGLRLPLTAVERATSNTGAASWPPALAYESFEAGAKKVLGSLLRDDELVRQGRLIQAKLSELAEAERLEAVAEQKRQAADAQLEQRQESAEEARNRVARQAEQREQQVAREKADKERQARQQAAQREQAAARTAELRDKVVTAEQRDADRTRIAEESAALAKRSQALAATKKAQTLDTVLDAKKAQRKAN
ncbi:MAG: hypothetical protein NVS3B12_04240 [Acidimicrobiales bacterium]